MNEKKVIGALDKITEWALYLLIFCLPFSKSIIEITIVAAFISWLLKKILTRDLRLKKTPLNALLLAFFIVSLISIINAEFKILVIRSLFTKCLKYIVLYYIIVESMNSETKLKNLLKLSLISAIIIMIDSFIQYYIVHLDILHLYPSFKYNPLTGEGCEFLGFPTGPFPFPNDLSAWMLVVFMPALYIFMWYPKNLRSRFKLGLFIFPFLFLFYLANTRSAWLGFFISFFLALLIRNKKKIIVILLALFIILSPFLPKDKVDDIIGYSSMQDRFYMWRIGWKIFLEHPIIGNGFNTFFLKFKEYREDEFKNKRGSYAHNGYLQIAADTGILGLMVFLLLICTAFRNIFKYIKEVKNAFYGTFALGLAAGLFAFLIHSFFDTNLQSLPLVTLFWFCLALLMSLKGIKEDMP